MLSLVRSKRILIMVAPISLGGESKVGARRPNRVLILELDSDVGVGVQTIEF